MAYLSLKFGDVYAESKGVMDDNIAEKCSKSLVIPTGKITDCIALKFFPETIFLLKVDHCEGIVNQIKIIGMVNGHSSSCNP